MSVEEIEAIVAAAREPFRLHKDIAQKFRVPALLVSGLVKEAEKQPEKLQAKRENEILEEKKRMAIEDAVIELLNSNKPISRVQ